MFSVLSFVLAVLAVPFKSAARFDPANEHREPALGRARNKSELRLEIRSAQLRGAAVAGSERRVYVIQAEARLIHPIGIGNPVPHSPSNFRPVADQNRPIGLNRRGGRMRPGAGDATAGVGPPLNMPRSSAVASVSCPAWVNRVASRSVSWFNMIFTSFYRQERP